MAVLVLLSLLPARYSGWVSSLAGVLKLAVAPVSGPVYQGTRLVMHDTAARDDSLIERERDHFKWLWLQEQRETERLRRLVEQLQKGQLLSESPAAQLVRPVVGSSSDGRGGTLDVRAGTGQGVGINDVATTEGVQIVGKVVGASAKLCTVRLITSQAAGGINGVVFTNDDKPGVKCSLSPSKTAQVLVGMVEYAKDGKPPPEVGQTVRLEDAQWPKHAQRLVIGVITDVKTVTSGRQLIEVRPTAELDRLSEVVLRLSPREADERTPALPPAGKPTGDGRP